MTLLGATRAALVFAALVAIVVARRRADYRPIAWFLAAQTVANFLRVALVALALAPARERMRAAGLEPAATPFTGAGELAAIYLDGAAFLVWPAGIAAMAVAVYLKRRPWLVGAVWALAAVGLAYAYPATRGDVLRRCYLAAELAALVVAIGSFLTWARRRDPPTLPIGVVLCIFMIDLGTLAGPYLGDPFSTWERAQALYLVLYIAIIVLQGGSLWRPSSPTSS